jgi:hypothetical protein
MRVRTHLLAVTVAALVLPASVASVAPVSAEPLSGCPAEGAVQGTLRDVDGTVPTGDALVVLYRWDESVGAFTTTSTSEPVADGGLYCFGGVDPGWYSVLVKDASGRYVTDTWAGSSGQMPTTTSTADGSGVVEVPEPPAPSDQTGATEPPTSRLDVTVLRQLSNEGAAPGVTGLRRFGYRLSATPGGWNPDASTLSFTWQWQRVDSLGNARDILGATGPTYVLTAAEVGNDIRVRATGWRAGYAPQSGYSDATEVKRAYSATGVRLAYRRIHATSRGRVRVTVTPSTAPPTGTVAVRIDGRKRLATTLGPTQAGSVALALPRLGRGTHRVVAAYGGSPGLYGSTSRATWLTVVR